MNRHVEMLGQEKIDKLLLKLSAPAIIGMVAQALYNVVNAVFVGKSVGVLGIAGLSIVFPIYLIIIAFIQIVGVGGSSIISRRLGANNIEMAEKTLGNMISLVLIISALITVFGSIYIEPVLLFFGATETILPYSKEYLSIILLGTVFSTYTMAINHAVRAEGNAKTALYVMLISAGLNTALDPIFIFGFNMGIKGAAVATVISQAFTAVYMVIYSLGDKSVLKIKIKNLKFDIDIVRETFAIGISAFAKQASSGIVVIIVNQALRVYGGDIAIAVYGVITRLNIFIYMTMFGIVQGLLPIVGFNYGAGKLDRVRTSIRVSLIISTILSIAAFLMFMLIPSTLFGIFSDNKEVINIGTKALRILGIGLPVLGYQIIGAGIFQAIGKPWTALTLSSLRQIFFLIPLIIILPDFYRLTGVWSAFPIADILTFIVTLIAVNKVMRSFSEDSTMLSKNLKTKVNSAGE